MMPKKWLELSLNSFQLLFLLADKFWQKDFAPKVYNEKNNWKKKKKKVDMKENNDEGILGILKFWGRWVSNIDVLKLICNFLMINILIW